MSRKYADLAGPFVRARDDQVTDSGRERQGHVTLTSGGVILYRAPGEKRAATWRWDEQAFRFVKAGAGKR